MLNRWSSLGIFGCSCEMKSKTNASKKRVSKKRVSKTDVSKRVCRVGCPVMYKSVGARIISVDVGVTNFAYAVLGADLLACEKRRVCDFKGSKDYVEMTRTVMSWFAPHIVAGTVLILERQMRAGVMQMFQVALEVAWYHTTGSRALVVSPIKVKKFWGTSTGAYKKNKCAAVAKMDELTESGAAYGRFGGAWSGLRLYHSKVDDFADALLQAFWGRAQAVRVA